MTKEEVIKALKIHADQRLSCEDCPLNHVPMCFDALTDEILNILDKEGDTDGRL